MGYLISLIETDLQDTIYFGKNNPVLVFTHFISAIKSSEIQAARKYPGCQVLSWQ